MTRGVYFLKKITSTIPDTNQMKKMIQCYIHAMSGFVLKKGMILNFVEEFKLISVLIHFGVQIFKLHCYI